MRTGTPAPGAGPGTGPDPGTTPDPGTGHGTAGRTRTRTRARARGRDRGQVALEYLGFVPVVLLVALCGIQLGWAAYVHAQADTAARTAARVEARTGRGGEAAGRAAVSSGLGAQVAVARAGDTVTATVTIRIKSLIPGVTFQAATARAVMPDDDPNGP